MKFNRKMVEALWYNIFGKAEANATPPKRSPSYTKKGPGRVHAGSPRKKIRGYIKHYDRNHPS